MPFNTLEKKLIVYCIKAKQNQLDKYFCLFLEKDNI